MTCASIRGALLKDLRIFIYPDHFLVFISLFSKHIEPKRLTVSFNVVGYRAQLLIGASVKLGLYLMCIRSRVLQQMYFVLKYLFDNR